MGSRDLDPSLSSNDPAGPQRRSCDNSTSTCAASRRSLRACASSGAFQRPPMAQKPTSGRTTFQGADQQLRTTVWLPFLKTYRTMCRAPSADFRRVLEDLRELRLAAYGGGLEWMRCCILRLRRLFARGGISLPNHKVLLRELCLFLLTYLKASSWFTPTVRA